MSEPVDKEARRLYMQWLAEASQTDPRCAAELVERCEGLVKKTDPRCIGFTSSRSRFDPSLGTAFATYAYMEIRESCRRWAWRFKFPVNLSGYFLWRHKKDDAAARRKIMAAEAMQEPWSWTHPSSGPDGVAV